MKNTVCLIKKVIVAAVFVAAVSLFFVDPSLASDAGQTPSKMANELGLVIDEVAASAHEQHAQDEHSSGGLPQLNLSTYPSQIFWLFVAFILMYVMFSASVLPKISDTLERRHETISSDLETADNLNTQTNAVRSEYEQAIEEARHNGAAVLNDLKAEIRKEVDESYNEFKDRSLDEIRQVEQRCEELKVRLLSEMKTASAEITSEIVTKVASIETSPKDAEAVIDGLAGKKAKAA